MPQQVAVRFIISIYADLFRNQKNRIIMHFQVGTHPRGLGKGVVIRILISK